VFPHLVSEPYKSVADRTGYLSDDVGLGVQRLGADEKGTAVPAPIHQVGKGFMRADAMHYPLVTGKTVPKTIVFYFVH
jgi:hypothetical protein